MKLKAFKNFVARETAPGDVVMMMDASDVLFVGDSQQILDAYQAIGTPIVASAELGCAPQVPCMIRALPESNRIESQAIWMAGIGP